MKDPLAGKRKGIMSRELKVLIWPAVDANGRILPCPVEKGEKFKVSGVPEIQIEKVSRKLPAGKPAEWHAVFVRLEVDRPQLLRRVPSGMPDGPDRSGRSDIERARVESAYTSSVGQAIVNEPESVGPDWEDRNRAERETERQAAVRERMTEERVLREANNLAARVKQEVIERGAKGHDLTHLLADVYERLASEGKEAA